MATFKVILDRVEYLTTTIYVEADNKDVAEEVALNECYNDQVEWECYDMDGPWIDFLDNQDDDTNSGVAYAC